MANEISTTISLQLINGLLRLDFKPAKIQTTQVAAGLFNAVRTIATTETTVALTGITTPKVAIIWNLDPTNYVQLAFATASFGEGCKLFPTGTGVPNILTLEPTVTTLYLKANTSACKVQIIVLEE
jgi:hypothetical protein